MLVSSGSSYSASSSFQRTINVARKLLWTAARYLNQVVGIKLLVEASLSALVLSPAIMSTVSTTKFALLKWHTIVERSSAMSSGWITTAESQCSRCVRAHTRPTMVEWDANSG